MANKLTLTVKRQVAGGLFVAFCLLGSLAPAFAPKSEAFLGIGDFGVTVDIKALAERLADMIAERIAQKMIDDMVQSTIAWANTGFNGNPAYVTNPTQYFGDIANGVAGSFIANSRVGFLCSPLQNVNLKISLARYYSPATQYQSQCTLTGIAGNIDDFYNNFDNGGWGTFIQMTQQPSNNPYGSYVAEQIQLNNQVAAALGLEQNKLNWNQGFKSKGDCLVTYHTPTPEQITDYENGVTGPGTIASGDVPYSDTLQDGDCYQNGPDKTPGSIIKSQLDQTLPSGLNKLITVEHVDQLVSAFANGLLQRYVFGPKGLFDKGYATNTGGSGGTIVTNPPDLICLTDTSTAAVDQTTVTYEAVSNIAFNALYSWQGEGFAGASTSEVSIIYHTPGAKNVQVTVASTDANGGPHSYSVKCPAVVASGIATTQPTAPTTQPEAPVDGQQTTP